MTERTKGPAVSMRRPPTRGPQDPWTPRKIALRGFFVRSCRAGPPLTGRRTTCISMTFTFAALRTLRETPRPAMPHTLPKSASGLSGTAQPAGHPAHPPPPRTLPKLASGLSGGGCSAGHPAPRGQPRTLPRRSRFFFPFLCAVGFMWRCGIFYVAGGSLTLPYRFRREDAAHEWGRRRHGNVHHAARSVFYEKVSLSFVGEDH